MIEAIADLGKYAREKDQTLSKFDIWLEDAYDGGKNPHLFLISFEKKEEGWTYSGVDYQENGEHLKSKLLYKRGSARGSNTTPTGQVSADIGKTFDQRIKGWFEGNRDSGFLEDSEREFLEAIRNTLNKNEQAIRTDLTEKLKEIEGQGVILSVRFVENGLSRYLGDYPFFSRFITEESEKGYKYSKTYKKESCKKNALCSVCRCVKDEVFGYFTPLKFYNVDKPGMVTGGFRQDQSWKNYPVCLECALDIEMGIKIKEHFLDYSLYGLRYYLIPTVMQPNSRFDIIDEILTLNNRPKINDKDRNTITGSEDEILDLLKDEDNYVSLNLVFYDKPQKEVFRILSSIEDVLPSRIRRLYDVKSDVDALVLFKRYEKDGKKIFRFNFGVIRTFFPNDKIRGNYNKAFLQIVGSIFHGTSISYGYTVGYIMKRIREAFIKGENEWFFAIQGFMLLVYLNRLGVLPLNQERSWTMDRTFYQSFEISSKDEFEDKVLLYFETFQDFFRTDAHKGVFLLGVLTSFLLKIQSNDRNATPFRSRLKGLKMDSRDMVGLLPMIIEKLEQYKKNYYKSLETMIAKFMVSAGDHNSWAIPLDELNYIFVLGMNLSDHFKIKKQETGVNL